VVKDSPLRVQIQIFKDLTEFKGFGRDEFRVLEEHFYMMFLATLGCIF